MAWCSALGQVYLWREARVPTEVASETDGHASPIGQGCVCPVVIPETFFAQSLQWSEDGLCLLLRGRREKEKGPKEPTKEKLRDAGDPFIVLDWTNLRPVLDHAEGKAQRSNTELGDDSVFSFRSMR
jgi:hypothetical protein